MRIEIDCDEQDVEIVNEGKNKITIKGFKSLRLVQPRGVVMTKEDYNTYCIHHIKNMGVACAEVDNKGNIK